MDSLLVSPKRPRVDDDELEEGGRDRASDQSDDSDASENEAREGEEGQEPESDDDDNGPEDPRAPWSERERAALAKYSQLKAEFPNAKGHASLAAALLPGRSLDDIEAAIQSSTVKAYPFSLSPSHYFSFPRRLLVIW